MIDKTCYSWVQLVKKSDLPSPAKYICLYLSTFMNLEHDIAWPSQVRISDETGLAKSTVKKWLTYLQEQGWLIIRRNAHPVRTMGGVQMQNEYLADIPAKVVHEATPLVKGGSSDEQRGAVSEQKGGRQTAPNINRNININIKGGLWKKSPGEVSEVGRQLGINYADFNDYEKFRSAVIDKAISKGLLTQQGATT